MDVVNFILRHSISIFLRILMIIGWIIFLYLLIAEFILLVTHTSLIPFIGWIIHLFCLLWIPLWIGLRHLRIWLMIVLI